MPNLVQDHFKTIIDQTAAIRETLEDKRRMYWQLYTMGVPMGFAITCAIAAMNTQEGVFPWHIVAIITLMITVVGYQMVSQIYMRKTKLAFLDKIAGALGLNYAEAGFFPARGLIPHGVLPGFDREHTEDGFAGLSGDLSYAFEEISLSEQYRDDDNKEKERNVFHGLVIRIAIAKTLQNHTIVMPRSRMNTIFRTTLSKYKPVNLVSPAFEEKFDTIATDQVEARYVLDPAFMERFMEAQTFANTRYVSASFLGQEIMIAIERNKPMFEIGSLWKPLTEDSLGTVLEELHLILQMIEALKLNPYTGLGAPLPKT